MPVKSENSSMVSYKTRLSFRAKITQLKIILIQIRDFDSCMDFKVYLALIKES